MKIKKILEAIIFVPNRIIYATIKGVIHLVKFLQSALNFLIDYKYWVIHGVVFIYIFKHGQHILTENFTALSASEKNKLSIAAILLICLIAFWLWKLLMAIWHFITSDKGENFESTFDERSNHVLNDSIIKSKQFIDESKNSPKSNTNHLGESTQTSSMSAEEKIADFEIRLNYKAQPLSDEEQDKLEAKFRSAAQLKKWPE